MQIATTIVVPSSCWACAVPVRRLVVLYRDFEGPWVATAAASAKIAVTARGCSARSPAGRLQLVSTGVITIPVMRESGYTSEAAGGIEAVASTGGQLMPPIMGASAFVMAEFLEIAYAEVVIAALVPAVLYYTALFIVSDLEAARTRIARVDERALPRARAILKAGWFFPLPFGVLVYALFGLHLRPEVAALYATLSLLACTRTLAVPAAPNPARRTDQGGSARTGNAAGDIILIVSPRQGW